MMQTAGMSEKKMYEMLTRRIIGAGSRVHQALGPALLESADEACTAYELVQQGLFVETQKSLPLVYRGIQLDCGYRLDMLVEGIVIVEFKSVETMLPIHEAQLMSYLKLAKCKVGLLLNFNVKVLKNGITRFVNGNLSD